MKLTAAQLDRSCGVLLATAAGDALGAGYEFGPPIPDEVRVAMVGGGSFGWQPGEWTDDTSMALAIAETAATGADLREVAAQDKIVARWEDWARTAKDVGVQTRRVLGSVRGGGAVAAAAASRELHEQSGKTAGNGSLMRTAPVALAYLDDAEDLVEAASALSALTHYDPEAAEACVLWCLAIRHTVLTGQLDVRAGLPRLGSDRATVWAQRLDVAERSRPADFTRNGWVVEALQAAWSAIATTQVPAENPADGVFAADHLRLALERAVRGGRDADTVAAIAGGLLGARWGASAVPAQWRSLLHGWPGLSARDLVDLAAAIVRRGAPDTFDFSYDRYSTYLAPVRHPYDEGVLLGGIGTMRNTNGGPARVSLCRVGAGDVAKNPDGIEVRLIDRNGCEENPNLDFVLADTVRAIQAFRAQGREVMLHCVQAQSRTPTVAALYGMRLRGVSADQALADVLAVMPAARPISDFRAALTRAGGASR